MFLRFSFSSHPTVFPRNLCCELIGAGGLLAACWFQLCFLVVRPASLSISFASKLTWLLFRERPGFIRSRPRMSQLQANRRTQLLEALQVCPSHLLGNVFKTICTEADEALIIKIYAFAKDNALIPKQFDEWECMHTWMVSHVFDFFGSSENARFAQVGVF